MNGPIVEPDEDPLSGYSADWRESSGSLGEGSAGEAKLVPRYGFLQELQVHTALRMRVARELGVAWRMEAPSEHERRRLAKYFWRLERAIGARCIALAPTVGVRRVAQLYVVLTPFSWLLCFSLTCRARPFKPMRRNQQVMRLRDVSPHDFGTRHCDN